MSLTSPIACVRFAGGAYDKVPSPITTTWADLFRDVVSADQDGTIALRSSHSKESTPAWSPVEYEPGKTKGKDGVRAAYALVLDFDGGPHEKIKALCVARGLACDTPEQMKAARAALPREDLEKLGRECLARLIEIIRNGKPDPAAPTSTPILGGLAHLWHTSWSHNTDAKPYAMRIVLPLSRPVTAAEWPAFWGRADAWFESIADPACSDVSRIYFCAARPIDFRGEDHKHAFGSADGALFDVDAVLKLPEPPRKAAAKARAQRLVKTDTKLTPELQDRIISAARSAVLGPGDRYKARLALAGTFRNFGVDEETATDLVTACDTGGEDGLGDADSCADKVRTTFAKDEGDHYAAEGSLRELVGDAIADAIVAALREGATSDAREALEAAAASRTYNTEGAVRALADLFVADRYAYEQKIEQIKAQTKSATSVQKLVQEELKKRKAAARATATAGSDFELGADDKPKASMLNTSIALQKMACFRMNTLRHEVLDTRTDSYMTDEDMTKLAIEIHKTYGFECVRYIRDAVAAVASDSSYDPIREYLRRLPAWDGVDRITPTVRQFSDDDIAPVYVKKTLIALCARGLAPPKKVDTILVFQGPQGYRKSTFFRVLGGDFFSDTALDLRDKDAKAAAARIWLHEWSEMVTARGADRDRLKSFASSEIDTFRPSYGEHMIESPRRTVFVGTLNEGDFLDDPTGSRRFWVVDVKRPIDIPELVKNCDQIWAQALAAYDAGEQWHLTPEEDEIRAVANAGHERENPWEHNIRRIAPNLPPRFTLSELCQEHLNLDARETQRNQRDICAALRGLGFVRHDVDSSRGGRRHRSRVWHGGDRTGLGDEPGTGAAVVAPMPGIGRPH